VWIAAAGLTLEVGLPAAGASSLREEEHETPVQLGWNAIDRIEQARVTVRCVVTRCGDSGAAVQVVQARVAANRSDGSDGPRDQRR